MRWGRIVTLIIKELQAVWRDKKSRAVLVVPPLIQLFVFAFAATLDVKNVTLGILNRDSGEQAIELIQRFIGSPTFSHIVFLKSVEEIDPFIDNQYGTTVISIDEQFSRNLDADKPADIQLILDGRKSNSTQIIAGYISNIVDQFNKDFAAKKGIRIQNTELIPRNWFNPNLLYYWFNVPSLSGILTLLVALILTALSVAREREMGTFDQLLVSPAEPLEILIGKTVPSVIISMVEGTVIVLVAIFVFKIPFTGSFTQLYFGMFIFVLCSVGVGLFISSLCSTQQQAILGSSIIMTPSVILSGFATPIENMPTWLQPITYIIPLRYYLVIAKGLFLKSMPWDVVIHNVIPMALIALVTLPLSAWFFRKRLQ